MNSRVDETIQAGGSIPHSARRPRRRMRRLIVFAVVVLASLTALAIASPAADAAPLTIGSRGPAVLALNERLADLGYLPRASVTSRFTTATYHAVVAFQKYERLGRDGVVGPRTRAALGDARRPRPRLTGSGRRIEVWRDRQLALLIRNGRAIRVVAVSTGKAGYTTPRGRFSVYRKERMSWFGGAL